MAVSPANQPQTNDPLKSNDPLTNTPLTNTPATNPPNNAPLNNAQVSTSPLANSIAPSLDSTFDSPAMNKDAGAMVAELPPGLQDFANIFSQSLEPTLPDASVPLSKAPDIKDDAPRADDASANDNSALPADVDQKLQYKFGGMRISQRPLSEVLSTISMISDVPIVADVDALSIDGSNRNRLIDFTATAEITTADLISKISSEVGIQFDSWENRALIVRSSSDALTTKLTDRLPINDLVSSEEQAQALLNSLKELLPELGEGVSVNATALTISFTETNRLTWYQVARLLETWRTMRGINNAETASLIPTGSQLPAWPSDALANAAQLKIPQALPIEPLSRTWQRLASAMKISLWVDAPGLVSQGTSPDKPARSLLKAARFSMCCITTQSNIRSYLRSKTISRCGLRR